MARIWMGQSAGEDVRKDLRENVNQVCAFVEELGMRWRKVRNDIVGNVTPFYDVLPRELVDMLDDAADVVTCEEGDCLAPVHEDWDFCEKHGRRTIVA